MPISEHPETGHLLDGAGFAAHCSMSQAGLLRFTFDDDAALNLEAQRQVIATVVATRSPHGVVLVVGPAVATIDLKLVALWLEAIPALSACVSGLAIVSARSSVRLAARGFSLAATLRQASFEVGIFADELEAGPWLQERLVVRLAGR